ncbi:nipped-B-like protein isoform X2 [Ischnura elegans]|uniref:nipped-B-like protein isoform X2 n=1 Tax=Ischnura elegans TaxID=197161 RepID=UPI001ED86A5E|nr:nipped-B-like protein isoform X2 [Ischnura elegans]
MNGEIPSVPITTLAGISSLTDLLPEMPLPSPLPQTLSNKSLLFHPRVAEEAQILLGARDDDLIPQLIQSLAQTSADHIELKDHYAASELLVEQQQNIPELLKAILQKNPNVFKGPQAADSPRQPHPHRTPPPQPQPRGPCSEEVSRVPPLGHVPRPAPPHGHLPGPPPPTVLHDSPLLPPRDMLTRSHAAPHRRLELEHGGGGQCGLSPDAPPPEQPLGGTADPGAFVHRLPDASAMSLVPGSGVIRPPGGAPAGAAVSGSCLGGRAPVHASPPAEEYGAPRGRVAHEARRVSVITEQPRITRSVVESVKSQNGGGDVSGYYNSHQTSPYKQICGASVVNAVEGLKQECSVDYSVVHGGNSSVLREELSRKVHNRGLVTNVPRTNTTTHTSGSSPAQASVAPVTHIKEESKISLGRDKKPLQDIKMKEPVVMLNRLSAEDQALMQRSIKAFAEKSPTLACKLGLTGNHKITRSMDTPKYKEMDSESESDEEPKNQPKYFKAREKEREIQRKKGCLNATKQEEGISIKVKDKEDRKKRRPSEDDDEYVPDNSTPTGGSLPDRGKKRKRGFPHQRTEDCEEVSNNDDGSLLPKKKVRKLERKLVPVLEKLSAEELMETNTYQRFNRSIEMIFDNTEDLDLHAELEEGADVPPEALIPKYQLQDMCSEAAKLKTLGAMESIPPERLVRLLNILEKNIRDGAKVSPIADPDDDEEESKLWLELTMERVMRAVDASLTSLHIMTSPNMPKRIYLEDVIDRVVLFTKYQLQNTIYPSFDPVYRVDYKAKDNYSNQRKKRAQAKEVREKSILTLYNKLHEVVALLAELLNVQVLTDTAVLHVSSLGVSPFFVEGVSDLQLSSLKLVTTIFTKYEKHRRLLLDDILASIARLPSSKRSLRTYRLSSEENIQMLTALVLQLIQCVVFLPDKLCGDVKEKVKEEGKENEELQKEQQKEQMSNVDRDMLMVNKYETAMRTAANFLSFFLVKCGSKNEEMDYRPLFENFVQDLLTTVNKPEWPATELLLSVLGTLLVKNFINKSTDMSLRVASLDYLGVVAARLRKDAVLSQMKLETIDQIIKEIKEEEQKESEELGVLDKKKKKKEKVQEELDPEEERTQFLQRVLLDYLAVNGQSDHALCYARHFYIAQWYRDATAEISRGATGAKLSPNKMLSKKGRKSKKKRKDESSEEEISEVSDLDDGEARTPSQTDEQRNSEMYRLIEKRKQFLISKIRPFEDALVIGNRTQVLQTYIGYESAELISRYLASKRPFSQSFDAYLKQILRVLTESSIAIRTKAMKCLTMVVEADPAVLGRTDMQLGVHHSFLDHSTSVREAAVDLVGKFVLSRPELIDKYYDMLSARILDTGVSVRKRVIKILKEICIECPEFPKIPEICVKMIRRVNDEEGIRKLVMEVFQNMWFTPVRERPTLDKTALIRKVMNITDVVATCRDIGLDWFEQLLLSLFKPKEDKDDSTKMHVEPPKSLLTACHQIVDCLIENVLRLEEAGFVQDDGQASGAGGESGEEESRGSSQRLVACLTTLYLFAKIRPQLLVAHAITLQPYLSLKCQTQGDYQIISNVARTLELVVPLMEHPSDTFLAQLEEDSVKLILQHDKTVVGSCLSCLGSVVNNVTRNFKLIRDCFRKYYGHLTDFKQVHEKEPTDPRLLKCRPFFRRALFTVGLLLRHFDFTQEEVRQDLPEDIKDQVFETLMYFVRQPNEDMQSYTLQAIGSLCIRHYEFMLGTELKMLYHRLLTNENSPLPLKVQVLNNIEIYLQEEERRMIKQDQEWAKLSKTENLKEMNDVSSGMASTVIQLYLKEVLESFLHPFVSVRHAALKVIQLILQQGLVHPVQIVPYLICMSTDIEMMVSHSADKQLQDIEKKYPGFIHMKSQLGIRLSYKLQKIVQGEGIVRGYRIREGEVPSALNGFLYSILRSTKQQRRAIASSILKQFDEQVKTSLSQMLYLADNMAYFPFQVQDEPLFIIHHIDIMISVSGTNLLQSFREALLPTNKSQEGQAAGAQLQAPVGANAAPVQDPNSVHVPTDLSEPGTNSLVASQTDGSSGVVCNSGPNVANTNSLRYDEEEDEDEDENVLIARLPEDTSVLQECITASQGCMLLLVLKQHLKDLYGITDAKISQYSPSESAKVYEKTVNRRNTSCFDPKATLQKLNEGAPSGCLDETSKRSLIQQYLEFKQLMLRFDPSDADEEDLVAEGGAKSKASAQVPDQAVPSETDPNCPEVQGAEVAGSEAPGVDSRVGLPLNEVQQPEAGDTEKEVVQRIPKLTIVPPRPPDVKDSKHHKPHKIHRSEKHRKHKHKKRRKRANCGGGGDGEEDDESDNEFSDPDFLV